MKKHNHRFPWHYIKDIDKLSFETSGRRYKFSELDGEYRVDRACFGKRKPYISIGSTE